MDRQKDTGVEAILEHLIEHGANDIATVFAKAFELAMQIERERIFAIRLKGCHYQNTSIKKENTRFARLQTRCTQLIIMWVLLLPL